MTLVISGRKLVTLDKRMDWDPKFRYDQGVKKMISPDSVQYANPPFP